MMIGTHLGSFPDPVYISIGSVEIAPTSGLCKSKGVHPDLKEGKDVHFVTAQAENILEQSTVMAETQ